MTQFSPKSALVKRAALCALALLPSSLPLKAALSTAAAPKIGETIFFTTLAGHHSVLGRCSALGTCKAYLGAFGQGWLPYADPAFAGDDLAAASAPDGSSFALISTRGGSVNLWLLSSDGRSAEALTQDDASIMKPEAAVEDSLAFSPDGSHLAYLARGELWVMTLKNRQTRSVTFDGDVRALCWSPTGNFLAFVQGDMVRKVAMDGSSNMLLVSGGCDQPSLVWSKDGYIYYMDQGAWRVDQTENTQLLFQSEVDPNHLAVLPQGVALLALSESPTRPEVFTSASSNASPGHVGPTQITVGGAQAVWAPADGLTLYFTRDKVLWRCSVDGSKALPLGIAPMTHISFGRLPSLPWLCR